MPSDAAPLRSPVPFLVIGSAGAGFPWAIQALSKMGYTVTLTSDWHSIAPGSPDLANLGTHRALVINMCKRAEDVKTLSEWLTEARTVHPDLKILRLSAKSDELLRRYAQMEGGVEDENRPPVQDCIEQEQLLTQALKPFCDYHLDTTAMDATDLHVKLGSLLGIELTPPPFKLTLMSFGFKYGVPQDAELVYDARVLPNPFYDPSLKPYSGLDKPVQDYVMGHEQSVTFLNHLKEFIPFCVPHYQAQGKTRLTVGIGCTGGQHRSVTMVMALAPYLEQHLGNVALTVQHREMNHWPTPTVPSGT